MRALGDYLQVKCHACVGGTSVREDTRVLQGEFLLLCLFLLLFLSLAACTEKSGKKEKPQGRKNGGTKNPKKISPKNLTDKKIKNSRNFSKKNLKKKKKNFKFGVHVVVGTPGRVYDMLRRRALRADSIKMFVLDEADEMLSRGFKDQIYDIFQLLPPKLQVGVFSATLPPEALEITRKFMNKPVRILVKRDELTLEGIKQFYVNVEVRR